MEPIVNNFAPPKPSDLDTISQDQNNTVSASPANLPNGLTEQAVLSYAKGRNTTWEGWFTPKFKLLEQNRELWRNSSVGGVRPGTTKPIPMAVGYAIVESVTARMNTTLLSRPKLVEAVSEEAQGDNDKQQTVEDFINQQLRSSLRKPEVGKNAIKSALLDAITIVRSTWKRVPNEVAVSDYQTDPSTGESLFMGQKPQATFKETAELVKKSAANCAWDIHCTTKVQDSAWFRERSRMSYNELLTWQQQGRIQNVEKIKNIVPSGVSGAQKADFETKLKKADGDSKWDMTYADEKLYQVDEWYARMTYTDKTQEGNGEVKFIDAHFFIVEGEHLVMFEENDLLPKRHPYMSGVVITDPDSVIGLSLLEAIKTILDAINNYSGKEQSLVEWCSNPTIFYGNKSGLSGRTTFSRPMGMQPVSDASDIKEFLGNPNSVKVLQEYILFLMNQAREASGANEQFQGIDGADTATEFQGLQAAAGSRFADMADTLDQSLFESCAQEMYWMYRQFGVDGQMVVHPQTEESAAVALTKADLQGDYRFVCVSAATEGYKGKQIADDNSFIKEMVIANQGGVFGQLQYNLPKHITEISMPLKGQKSSKNMFVPAPPPAPPKIDPPKVSVSLKGEDVAMLGLTPAVQEDFGIQPAPPPAPMMPEMSAGMAQ